MKPTDEWDCKTTEFLADIPVKAMGVTVCVAAIEEWHEAQAAEPAKSSADEALLRGQKPGPFNRSSVVSCACKRKGAGEHTRPAKQTAVANIKPRIEEQTIVVGTTELYRPLSLAGVPHVRRAI